MEVWDFSREEGWMTPCFQDLSMVELGIGGGCEIFSLFKTRLCYGPGRQVG